MSSSSSTNGGLIREAVVKIISLPEEDLPLIIELAEYLEKRRGAQAERKLSVAAIRAEARRQANALKDVPHEEIVARFKELAESIRTQAALKGTAIEGDWQGD